MISIDIIKKKIVNFYFKEKKNLPDKEIYLQLTILQGLHCMPIKEGNRNIQVKKKKSIKEYQNINPKELSTIIWHLKIYLVSNHLYFILNRLAYLLLLQINGKTMIHSNVNFIAKRT